MNQPDTWEAVVNHNVTLTRPQMSLGHLQEALERAREKGVPPRAKLSVSQHVSQHDSLMTLLFTWKVRVPRGE